MSREQRNYPNKALLERTDRFLIVANDDSTYNLSAEEMIRFLNGELDFSGGQGGVNYRQINYGNTPTSIVDRINAEDAITVANNDILFLRRTDPTRGEETFLFISGAGQYGNGGTAVTANDLLLIDRAVYAPDIDHDSLLNFVQNEHILPDGTSLVIENNRLVVKQVNGHTVESNVPADAVFTDTQRAVSNDPTLNDGNIAASTVATTTINTALTNHVGNTSNPHNVRATQITDFQNTVSVNTDVAANTSYRSVGHIPLIQKGANNGVAPLDSSGRVPASHLPAASSIEWEDINGRPSDLTNLSVHTSDELPEGINNLYFSNARVNANATVMANAAYRAIGHIPLSSQVNFVTIDGAQTITGSKTFSGGLTTNAFTLNASPVANGFLKSDSSGVGSWALLTKSDLPSVVAYTDQDNTFQGTQTFNNIVVTGTRTIQNSVDLSISDNVIIINDNESGSGVTERFAGIEIDRGTLPDVGLIFDEQDDKLKFGPFDVINGNVVSASGPTVVLDSSAPSTDDALNGRLVRFSKTGQQTQNLTITDYVGSTRTATLSGTPSPTIDNTWNWRVLLTNPTELNEIWHAGNDGAGSGLDADLLDGQQGSYYAPVTLGAGSRSYLSLSGQVLTAGDVNLATSTTGVLQWANGGTGATTPATARSSLGLEIGVDIQRFSGDLNAIAGITGISGLLRKSGEGSWGLDTNAYWHTGNFSDQNIARTNITNTFEQSQNFSNGIAVSGNTNTTTLNISSAPGNGLRLLNESWLFFNNNTNNASIRVNYASANNRLDFVHSDNSRADIHVGDISSENISVTGTVTATNHILSGSDRKLKTNIEAIKDVSWVDDIELKQFNWISDNVFDYGVIAQDLQKKAPWLVSEENDTLHVNYTGYLIAKIARLEERIKQLEAA